MNAWPVVDDVKGMLRMRTGDPLEDPIMARALEAAIDYGETLTNGRFHRRGADGVDELDVPPGPWEACLLHACRLYRRRDSLDGTIGWGEQGIVRVGRVDPDVAALYGAAAWNVFA
jgi:hypothetical protein